MSISKTRKFKEIKVAGIRGRGRSKKTWMEGMKA